MLQHTHILTFYINEQTINPLNKINKVMAQQYVGDSSTNQKVVSSNVPLHTCKMVDAGCTKNISDKNKLQNKIKEVHSLFFFLTNTTCVMSNK